MKLVLVTATLAVSLLAACASVNVNNPDEVFSKVKVTHDNFKKTSFYEAPSFQSKARLAASSYLRGAKMQSGEPLTQQLVVEATLYDWAFLDTAYDSDGQQLDVTILSRQVGSCSKYGCSVSEVVAVNFPSGYLAQHAATGIKLQVSGRGGSQVVEIAPAYLKGFMRAATFAR